MNKIKIGGIIAVIAVLMLVISLAMPWYTTTDEDEEGETSTRRQSLDILPMWSHSEEDTHIENQTSTLSITSVMATVGTGASMLSLLFIGIAIGSDSKKHAKIGSVLLVIGLIFAIIAPIYLMISYPDAVLGDEYDGDEDNIPEERDDTRAESFFGSETHETWRGEVEASWGGGIGWFMSLIGGILLLISLILVALGGKSKAQRRPVREEQPMQQGPRQQQWSQGPEQQPRQQPQQEEPDWGPESQQIEQEPIHQQEQAVAQQPAHQQQVRQEPQQAQQSNTCPDCGQPIRYIEEYNSWYCDSCQEYK